MQRVLHKKKKSEPKTVQGLPLDRVASASSPSLATSQSSAGAGRRHAATLYHHKSATVTLVPAPLPPRDQVVVGLSASTEDEVEDWSSDFLSAEPRPRWRQHESLEISQSDTQVKRRSSSSSNGMTGCSRRGSEVCVSSSSSGHADDEDTRALYSSYASAKDARPQLRTEHADHKSDSDEDWDVEFGFEEEADATLDSSGNMDPTRRRAENGNFFLPNLHEVLDGETLPDDDEMDDGGAFALDGSAPRRHRRLSEEPLFQKKRSELHQSPASVDGSSDGIRSSMTSATSSSSVEYTLVDKLRLLEVASTSAYAVRIERYPKPSSTFSQLERDRVTFPSLTENLYERWLVDLINPQCTVVSRYMDTERNRLPPPRQLKNQQFHALVSLPFGREFVDMFFKQISHYRFFGEEKENRELLRMYFEKVATTGMTDDQWAHHLNHVDLDYVVGCSIEILQEAARLYGPKPVAPLATHLSLSMLASSSSASSQGNKTTIYWIQHFQDILVHCAEAFPHYSNVVALLELRYVCHHLAGFASGEYQYMWQICNQLPSFLPLEPVVGDSVSQIVNEVFQYYGALFQHLNTSPDSRSHRYMGHTVPAETQSFQADKVARQYALTSDVICLQALVLCDIQSLYDSKSALAEIPLPALEELLEFEDDEATVDPSLVDLLPCNRDCRSSSFSSNTDRCDSGYERIDSSKGLGGWSASSKLFELLRPSSRTRNSALSFFYERIAAAQFPLVKAKCASVLATMHVSSTTSHGNFRVAESLAYEAVRLLDVCSKRLMVKVSTTTSRRSREKTASVSCLSVFNNDGILSDLGREALESLGNILIKNNKYRYGILCLEAAGTLFSFLNQGCEYEKLDRLLCKLTLEADDVNRALPLHEKVTFAAQRQGNITVYVYLTQEMTKLWIQEGNFTRAEEYLATACHFLRDNTNLLPPHFLSAISEGYSGSEAPSSRSGTMMTATSSSVSSSLSGSFHLSSRSTGNANEVDTWLNHDINLHLLIRDVYRSSGRCLEGMRVLEHLLNYSARLPRGKRTQLRMLLAEDALKMRMFDTCRHMFCLIEREAAAFCERLQENIKGFSGPGSNSGTGPGTSSSGGGRSLGGMGSEARYCFDMSFTLRYIVCRVKMYLKLGDFRNAYAWLSLAHVKNDQDNVRKQAQLHVLDGKVLRALVQEAQEGGHELQRDFDASSKRGCTGSTFVESDVSPAQVEEMLKLLGVSLYGLNKDEKNRLNERMLYFAACVRDVDKAEEQAINAFWTAFDQYRLLDDRLFQLKVLLDIVSFMLAPIQRSFLALGSNQDDEMLKSHLQRRSANKGFSSASELKDLGGDDTIEKTRKTLLEAQKLLRPALNLAEQVAYPACFLQTLIFCGEVWVWLERIASYKSEKHLKEATAFWEEAVRVMKGVFFRRVAFHDIADAQMLHSSGFNADLTMPCARGLNKGRFCVVPILNFSEGFIVKLEAMTLQLILAACQLQQFERVPEYVEETLLVHLDELLSARMCLSSIVHQLQTFRAVQRSHKRLPPSGSVSNLAAAVAALPSGSSVSVSSVGSSNSRSSSFSSVIPIPSPQRSTSGKKNTSTPSPSSAGVAGGKRASHKKNQSMSSISEMLASNAPSPYQEGANLYGFKSSATPRTGLASLSERPNVPSFTGKSGAPPAHSGHSFKKSSERKSRRYTRERSRSAPQPEVPAYSSPRVDLVSSRTGDEYAHEESSMPVAIESGESTGTSLKRTSSVKFIDLGDLQTLPSGEDFLLGRNDGFGRDEGSSSNGAIGLCDFDEVQSEKLWWIFNLWRNAKFKYVEGKIETLVFRSSNLRYLRTLLDAFDPQQIAVLYYGGIDSTSTDSVVTPGGTRVISEVNTGNPNGMLDFDVSRMNSHALIQDRQLVLSIGYEYSREVLTPFGTHPKLQFKVFGVREGETKAWRQEIPRPDWYLSEYDMIEAEEAAVGAGILRTMRLLGAKLLVKLLGVLLMETSVVIVGNSYPQIQEMTTSLLKLLEPFRWQHTFLPFVPVTSWRFLYDAVYQHAQVELAARPKSRRSFSRLSHDWRAWSTGSGGSAGGSSFSSSQGSTDSLPSSNLIANEPLEEEPPFLLGATADTWQNCLAFSKKCGNDSRLLTSCVVVVDLDDVNVLATDKTLRNAVPLPKKWRRQFLDRIEKITRQRHKMRLKMGRRHVAQQLVASRGATTPASASNVTSIRSPPVEGALRSFDDALSLSRSGGSWMMTSVSASNVSDSDNHYHLMQSGVHPLAANGLDDRKHYDSECAAAFVSGVREFYDKLLVLCAEKEHKAQGSKKKKKNLSASGHSKRQEIKSWFSSSHDFDAFVDHFLNSDLLEALEKEKAAVKAEAHAQARALQQLERRFSEHDGSSTSSGRSTRFGTTPQAIVKSFTPQLKSFGSFSSLSTSNRTSGGGQEGKR